MLPAEYAKTASTKTEGEQRRKQDGREMWIKKTKRKGRTGKQGARKREEDDERKTERDLKVMRGDEK